MRLSRLHAEGIRTWHDVLAAPKSLPPAVREALVAESRQALEALERDDIAYFVQRLHPLDKWRILSRYLERTTFFDIETTGLDYDAGITVIACWHRGELQTFVEHENLDEFLDLLEDVELLASFNGSTFDVPRVLEAFHVPALPCPHLDLRWTCYHRGLRGGLKEISTQMGIARPSDLADADGELAVRLWWDWRTRGNAAARNLLIRYCAADVLLLRKVSRHVAGLELHEEGDLWVSLPAATKQPAIANAQPCTDPAGGPAFGSGSPSKLRARRSA